MLPSYARNTACAIVGFLTLAAAIACGNGANIGGATCAATKDCATDNPCAGAECFFDTATSTAGHCVFTLAEDGIACFLPLDAGGGGNGGGGNCPTCPFPGQCSAGVCHVSMSGNGGAS